MNSNKQQYFIDTVIANHGNVYSFEKTIFVDNNTSVILTCIKHNYDFTVRADTLMRKQ